MERFRVRSPELWLRSGTAEFYLAARQDREIGYVTVSVNALREGGLIPTDSPALEQGDCLAAQVGRCLLILKVNRASLGTAATHWPAVLPMPHWRSEGGSEKVKIPVTILGFMGFNKTPAVRRVRRTPPVSGQPVSTPETTGPAEDSVGRATSAATQEKMPVAI
ncbi:MAG: hypothetical protein PHV34_17165 [Verrucomicrobiae bacterium]|nr:hypothetical protein [Verrucomicrobiae bacterium]